ncbi:PDZ domain-containing protein [Paenibacillus sp. TRM 82003]|uniref:YlbL family protein n=1 Tax=Kineococcus sp. TRM81007 TaxID=2925831 RepID=UPI001F58278A|nr:PDZ domain-containing protein [Kineococcus sp. TRM81007]MCI2239214.1 PDZ domain-containing protein [Kineococcus sp. TRM81007]MCI3924893.1 PDZ domain-containing protein [Paenibacillus sp. TRM 82003]
MPPATSPEPEPEPGGVGAERRGASPRGVLLAVSSFCAVALVALVGVLEVPYVSLSPGPVRDVLPAAGEQTGGQGGAQGDEQVLVEVSGAPTYPTDGSLDLTTVSLRGGPGLEQSLWEALVAWRDPDVSVVPRELYYSPRTTREEADAASAAEMAGSQEAAEVAALTELGIDVTARTTRRVQEVAPAAPAAGVLRPGDVVTSVDGAEVTDFEALKAAVSALPAGAEVRLGITRGGEPREVTTSTYAPEGETLLGIVPDVEYDSPVEVDIAIEDIGGPSAGTVFALAVVDLLTPGALTGGEHVAGTGAIRADGTVLPIGGLRQKVVGAQRAGAEWFLAPAQECGEVAGVAPEGITVVGVRTLHEARTAVEAIGEGRGAEVATCAQIATAG